ncbi:CoA pyrophosphatase [Saccharopolyspora sp. NFXS83]|uniref:NUDIX hydrolase n=1 Tax=Saccharopolyspora sp. NFXS83 TaxID=2993560 RepID=UPI00224B0AC4|nr:CoA pyrophosphatase [Saccharopolyspora sp. NFXS83]MCX2732843.1 CoA pyrophosphatase [Saccharopolyspora sp. NFXS83]
MTDRVVDGADAPEWLRPLVQRSVDIDQGHFGWPRLRPPRSARPAAVLILFGEHEDGPDVLLLRRADGLSSHPGQVAFPGGSIDDTDAGPVDAALREAQEEVGVLPAGIRPLATLPELHVPHSGFRVTPVLAHWREPSPVAPVDLGETRAVARVPLSWLADPVNRVLVGLRDGRRGPAFLVPGMLVWGFTGALLSGVLDLGGWSESWEGAEMLELDEAWRAAEEAADVGFDR